MAARLFITVTLPANRLRTGSLELWREDGATITRYGIWECLGKADNQRAAKKGNPSRDSTRIKGDTPTGVYAPTKVTVRPHYKPGDGVGADWIPLDPQSGDAALAKANGRTGLGIHAERGNYSPSHTVTNGLVPTEGCIRMRQRDYDALKHNLAGAFVDAVIVKEGPAFAGIEALLD